MAGRAGKDQDAPSLSARQRDDHHPRLVPLPSQDEQSLLETGAPGLGGEGVTATLRLTREGVLTGGAAPSALIDIVAYAAQLADLVGELIGTAQFVSIEYALSDGACVITRAVNGDVLAARGGRAVDAGALKQGLLLGDQG
jgi:hypothetical protein